MVLPTRLIFLAMGKVLYDGFNMVSSTSDSRGSEAHICIIAIKDKKIGFLPYCLYLSLCIMSSCLRRYSVFNLGCVWLHSWTGMAWVQPVLGPNSCV